jgi:predicted N-acetyltransferase YhbS
LLVPFPTEPPGAEVIDRARELGAALSRAASAKAAALGIDTVTLNAEAPALYESLGFRSLGTGQTWWRHDP